MTTIEEIIQKYSQDFINWIDDITVLENFITEFVKLPEFEWYEITTVKDEDWNFDVMYNVNFWDRMFYVCVDYIEYMNASVDDWIEEVIQELEWIYERIKSDVLFIEEYNNK